MSEKPDHNTGAPAGAPEQAEQKADGQNPQVSRETTASPAPHQKNKPSSAYLYLVVLFGAAFLMLLLAYFVQQRNNAAAMDDLRSTTSASRQELLEEIDALKEDNRGLQEERQQLEANVLDLDAQLKKSATELDGLTEGYEKYVGYTSILEALYAAEVKLEARDYDGAAAELTDIEYPYFVDTIGNYDAEMEHYNPEGMLLRPRFDALVAALTERGALDENWAPQE